MEIPNHRQWMYIRKDRQTKSLCINFVQGVEEFILAACQLDSFKDDGTFRCPCAGCKCLQYLNADQVRKHLHKKGFQPDYYYWHNHGETAPSIFSRYMDVDSDALDNFEQMVMDGGGNGFNYNPDPEEPNPTYARFYELLCAAQSPLWDGCENHSVLSIAVRLMSIKSDYNIVEGCVDEIITLIKEVLPFGIKCHSSTTSTACSKSKFTPPIPDEVEVLKSRLDSMAEENGQLKSTVNVMQDQLTSVMSLLQKFTGTQLNNPTNEDVPSTSDGDDEDMHADD